MDPIEGKQLLWCLLCQNKFCIRDIEEGTYLAQTGICAECYGEMQKSSETCFGKENKARVRGYDESTLECSQFCPDRKVCKEFLQVSIQKRDGKGKSLPVFAED